MEIPYQEQVDLWNRYYSNDPLVSRASVTRNSELSMPFISGEIPNVDEVIDAVRNMMERGFIMTDFHKVDNFIIGSDGICRPIDFGCIYYKTHRFYSAYLGTVKDQLRRKERQHGFI